MFGRAGFGRAEYWDSQPPGFGLRRSNSGRKTWVALYRVSGQLVRETIGTSALIPNIADARERARQSMQKAQAGHNPVAGKRERGRAAAVAAEKPHMISGQSPIAILSGAPRSRRPGWS
ncbi:MAG: DUF4102 domain-containing protein [Acetobacteraceae bacterium]|nr:DUF4102 domain-containing protein [Acetobacteraceae bacterium]